MQKEKRMQRLAKWEPAWCVQSHGEEARENGAE